MPTLIFESRISNPLLHIATWWLNVKSPYCTQTSLFLWMCYFRRKGVGKLMDIWSKSQFLCMSAARCESSDWDVLRGCIIDICGAVKTCCSWLKRKKISPIQSCLVEFCPLKWPWGVLVTIKSELVKPAHCRCGNSSESHFQRLIFTRCVRIFTWAEGQETWDGIIDPWMKWWVLQAWNLQIRRPPSKWGHTMSRIPSGFIWKFQFGETSPQWSLADPDGLAKALRHVEGSL